MVTGTVNERAVRWDYPHAWLVRFTFDGDLIWSREWGMENRRAALPTALSVASWGATYVVGQVYERDRGPNLFVRKFAPQGRLLWTSTICPASSPQAANCSASECAVSGRVSR